MGNMKRRKRMTILFIAIAVAIYLFLLLTIYLIESQQPDATIRTFRDAVWYSIVTFTTVGYGDVAPVTPVGRFIGIIFLVLAAGIMVTMFGTVVRFVASSALPTILLGRLRKKNWYYFMDTEKQSVTLAGYIVQEDKDAVIIFGENRGEQKEIPGFPCIYLNESPEKIVSIKKGVGSRCKVFLLKENDIGRNSRALNVAELDADIYASTTNGSIALSDNIHIFREQDCVAREYWRSNPLGLKEEHVVIIGFGNYGKAILERAILTNILSVNQHIVYHIFGDASEFRSIHYRLDAIFSIDEVADDRDSLIFHKDEWYSDHKLIEKADRIIVTPDDELLCWDIFWKLKRLYRIHGKLDVRSGSRMKGVACFGYIDEIYTPRNVLRTRLNAAAITMNELFQKAADFPTLSWEELDDFQQQSKISAADHLLTKIRILLKDWGITELDGLGLSRAYIRYSHTKDRRKDMERYRKIDYMRWSRFYIYYNWQYGEVLDKEKKEHPLLIPYDQLSDEQKAERDHAWELMGNLSSEFLRMHIDMD